MASVNLSLETIGDLDAGVSRAVINQALQALVDDLDDRGSDLQVRKFNLTVEAKQLENEEIDIKVVVKNSLPPYKTHATHARISKRSGKTGLQFQTFAPDRPDQGTLPVLDEQHDAE